MTGIARLRHKSAREQAETDGHFMQMKHILQDTAVRSDDERRLWPVAARSCHFVSDYAGRACVYLERRRYGAAQMGEPDALGFRVDAQHGFSSCSTPLSRTFTQGRPAA